MIKAEEKQRTSPTDGLPESLPALLWADKVVDRLRREGIAVPGQRDADHDRNDAPAESDERPTRRPTRRPSGSSATGCSRWSPTRTPSASTPSRRSGKRYAGCCEARVRPPDAWRAPGGTGSARV